MHLAHALADPRALHGPGDLSPEYQYAWQARVEAEGLRCHLCGWPPSAREGHLFLRTGSCTYCAYHLLVRTHVLRPAHPLQGGFPT